VKRKSSPLKPGDFPGNSRRSGKTIRHGKKETRHLPEAEARKKGGNELRRADRHDHRKL
jgi:hypothetical protein